MRRPDWQPILKKSLRDAAEEAIHAITDELLGRDYSVSTPAELCDIALLCTYMESAQPSCGLGDRAIDFLNLASDRIAIDHRKWLGLFGGLAGCGWIFDHLSRMLSEIGNEESSDDLIDDIDAFILKAVQQPWAETYDLISGLVGLGIYFLERLPRESAVTGIQLIVSHLAELSELSWGGTTWHTPPKFISKEQLEECPTGYYNLGIAHGVPGVAALLGSIITAELEVPGCRDLLQGSMQWIIAQQRSPADLSRYDSWFVPGREPKDCRLGWCYGDLGLSAVLHRTALEVGREDWRDIFLRIFDHTLARTIEDGWIVDQGLCHGAVGVAHINNRMFQTTKDRRYADSANFWYEHALQTREPGTGIAGFYTYRTDRTPNRQPDASFLAGASGTALGLISALYPVEPSWDRLLLLSGRT